MTLATLPARERLHALGRAGGPPQFPANLLGDFGGGGMLVAFGICAALVERANSGAGQVIDAAIVDGVASFCHALDDDGPGSVAGRTRREPPGRGRALVRRLRGGGRWLVRRGGPRTAVLCRPARGSGARPTFRTARTRRTGRSCGRFSQQRFKQRTRDQWTKVFSGSDACVEPVLSLHEATEDAHLAARANLLSSETACDQPAPAPRFSRTPGALSAAPSCRDSTP